LSEFSGEFISQIQGKMADMVPENPAHGRHQRNENVCCRKTAFTAWPSLNWRSSSIQTC